MMVIEGEGLFPHEYERGSPGLSWKPLIGLRASKIKGPNIADQAPGYATLEFRFFSTLSNLRLLGKQIVEMLFLLLQEIPGLSYCINASDRI